MSSPYDSPNEFQPPPQRRRVWPFVLGGCAVFFVVMIALCGGLMFLGYRQVSGGGEVAAEVDRLFDDIAQGKAAEFYQSLCAPELKKTTSEAEFVRFAESINQNLGKLQSKSVTGFSFNNRNLVNYVDATYNCQFEHGTGTVTTKFKHENERWLLLSFFVDSPELPTVKELAKCPHCGEPVEADAKFCPHCGEKLVQDDAE